MAAGGALQAHSCYADCDMQGPALMISHTSRKLLVVNVHTLRRQDTRAPTLGVEVDPAQRGTA